MDPSKENEDVIIGVSQVCLEIYWHKLLVKINSGSQQKKSSRSKPSFSTNSTASLVNKCMFTQCTAIAKHTTSVSLTQMPKTDKGTRLD